MLMQLHALQDWPFGPNFFTKVMSITTLCTSSYLFMSSNFVPGEVWSLHMNTIA